MTKVKICGITNLEDALLSAEFGADALGFNFFAKSPRYITSRSARHIIDKVDNRVATVGVFVNAPVDEVLQIANESKIDIIQLHGDESPEFVENVFRRSGLNVIKAFRISGTSACSEIDGYEVDAVLLDAYSTGVYGGSGELADWGLSKVIAAKYPKVYLAGGLDPENVGSAIRMVRPYAVDVASGVEAAKGKKDPKKVEAFILNAKKA